MPLVCSRENHLLGFRGDQYSKEKEMGRGIFTENLVFFRHLDL